MQELIEVIGAAIATDASKEQKAAGVQACHTIVAALDTEPGRPMVLPGVRVAQPLAGVSLDHVLDLMIARLSVIAKDSDANESLALAAATALAPPTSTVSRGLRVPLATGSALKAAPRSANTARAPQRPAARPANPVRTILPRKS